MENIKQLLQNIRNSEFFIPVIVLVIGLSIYDYYTKYQCEHEKEKTYTNQTQSDIVTSAPMGPIISPMTQPMPPMDMSMQPPPPMDMTPGPILPPMDMTPSPILPPMDMTPTPMI